VSDESKETEAAQRYTCCQCPADMTAAVLTAVMENLSTMRLIVAGVPSEPETVILPCPVGHLCVYTIGDDSR
jgi:hypothetical protein